jgi:CBS domain containing-hemolysin-like protein
MLLTVLAVVLLVPLLILLNAFFVAAEFALVAVRRTKVETMVDQGVPGALSVETATKHLDRSIAATQLGITIASIVLGWVGEQSVAKLVEHLLAYAPEEMIAEASRPVVSHTIGSLVAIVAITFMHVVFGELLPKTIALQVPDQVALWVSSPLNWFAWISGPFLRLMNGTAVWLARRMGLRATGAENSLHSVEELLLLVEDTEEAGMIGPEQADFVENVFLLSNKLVADIMVPREEVAALDIATPPGKILEIVRSGAHTRLPVYQGDLNHIVGIVNTKDLFYLFSLEGIVILEDAIYPALFLQQDQPVTAALRLFKREKRPMAVVVDSSGKTTGILTLENVLEEIVGDIEDEHDITRTESGSMFLQPGTAGARSRQMPKAVVKEGFFGSSGPSRAQQPPLGKPPASH